MKYEKAEKKNISMIYKSRLLIDDLREILEIS
jgi:hypothetical protein